MLKTFFSKIISAHAKITSKVVENEYTQNYSGYYILFFSLFMTCVLFWNMYGVGFWIIDDHELISIWTSFNEKGFSLKTFFEQYLSTEIGSYLEYSRFRPIYYFTRILVTALFGLDASAYFMLNGAVFLCGLLAMGFALKRFFSMPAVCILLGIVAVLPYNADLWVRLGPSERGAFLFTTLFLLGLSRLDISKWAWPLCCIAVTLAIGYKENFVLFMIPLFAAALYRYFFLKQNLYSNVWMIFPVVISGMVSLLILKILSGKLSHIYGEAAVSTISVIIKFFKSYRSIPWVVGFISFFVYFAIRYTSIKSNYEKRATLILSFFVFTITFIIALLTYIFYKDELGSFSRYGFPYDFLCVIGFANIIYFFFLYEKIFSAKICSLFLLPAILIVFCGLYIQNQRSYQFIKNINEFNIFLEKMKAFDSIILIPNNFSMQIYEPYHSLLRFAKAKLAPSKIYLDTTMLRSGPDAFGDSLKSSLVSDSLKYPFKIENKTVFVSQKNGSLLFAVVGDSADEAAGEKIFIYPNEVYDEYIFLDTIKLYIPFKGVGAQKVTILGNFNENITKGFVFYFNGQAVNPVVNKNSNSLTFNLKQENLSAADNYINILNLYVVKNGDCTDRNEFNVILLQ